MNESSTGSASEARLWGPPAGGLPEPLSLEADVLSQPGTRQEQVGPMGNAGQGKPWAPGHGFPAFPSLIARSMRYIHFFSAFWLLYLVVLDLLAARAKAAMAVKLSGPLFV